MASQSNTLQFLGQRRVIWFLFAMNILVAMIIAWLSGRTLLADSNSYLALADSILNGEYSQWWQLDVSIPDTTRTPGFPLYIAFVVTLFGYNAIGIIQFLFYVLALYLVLQVLERIDSRPAVKSIFLLLLIPLVNIPYYIPQYYPEIPVLLAISAAVYITTDPKGIDLKRALALGALYGFIFQCRPIFLLFPPALFLLSWLFEGKRSNMRMHLLTLLVFAISLLPYGYWNKINHGVFKITPLESGGGIAHIGYWAGKIPGYKETFYWGNFTGDEVVRFTPEDSIPSHIAAFEQEWEQIRERTQPLLNSQDSIMLRSRSLVDRPVLNTFNSEYTLERERLLNEYTLANIKSDPWYYLLNRAYTAVRLWVIGIQKREFEQASSTGKLKQLFPTIITGLLFLLAIISIPLAYFKKQLDLKRTYVLLSYLIYFWVIHLPFVIQARYTTSVRFVMLALLALSLSGLFWGKMEHPRAEEEVPRKI